MKIFNVLVLAVMLITSCTYRSEIPVSTGKTSEILIYVPDHFWNTSLADTIKHIFLQAQQGLNQPEPMFTLLQMNSLSDLFKRHRNILEIIIADTVKEARLGFALNVHAKPQTYFKAYARDIEQMCNLLRQHEQTLIEKFRKTNILRIQRAFAMHPNRVLQRKIQQKFGLSLTIPESFYLAKEDDDFMWLRLETAKYSQGIIIYRTVYPDLEQMTYEWLINWKNFITQKYIPAEVEGSYMRTDTTLLPYMTAIQLNNIEAIELRGLWMAMHDFMGGPFVAVFFTDPDKQYVYALDAYVYHPNREKRDLLLQLEAILHSVDFVE